MIKKISLFSLIFMIGFGAYAQERYFDERYTYTQHFLYPVVVNPGATGMTNPELLLNYRNKWAAFPGTPKTLSLSYNTPVGKSLGFGALLLSDSNGALETTKGQVSFSYRINTPSNKVGFGLSTEFIQHKIGEISQLVDLSDPLVLDRLNGTSFFDVSFGIWGEYNNQVTYGIAVPAIISSNLDSESTSGVSAEREIGVIINLGYKYKMSDTDVQLEPSIFVKKLMFVPTHVDANLKATFLEERLTAGVTFGIGADKRLGFLMGTKVNNLNLFYSYNVSSHGFQDYNNGSHDLTIAINLSRKEIGSSLDLDDDMFKIK